MVSHSSAEQSSRPALGCPERCDRQWFPDRLLLRPKYGQSRRLFRQRVALGFEAVENLACGLRVASIGNSARNGGVRRG
jgi:hypothetical protein